MTMPSARPVPTAEDVQAGYGFVGLLAKAIPELSEILLRATREQWTPDRFVQTVADSKWYKSTPAAQREWITKQITDPASAEEEIRNGSMELQAELSAMGAGGLGPDPTTWLRERYVEMRVSGMADDPAARKAWLWQRYLNDPNAGSGLNTGGQHAKLVREAFQMAHDYGYQSGDLTGEVLRWVNGVMTSGGTADIGGWQSHMVNYATAMYAPYKDEIRGGRSVADIAKPVMDRVAQLLEVNPMNVNVNDPLVRKAMTEWNPEGRAYSLREIEDATRRDARWKTTDNAKQGAVQMMEEIGTKMGFMPGSARG
jgi:hypothetical protein